jgi:phage I-like protein
LTKCASSGCAASEAEALELKEEFARRLGEQQRTIDILKVIVTASAATAALSGGV